MRSKTKYIIAPEYIGTDIKNPFSYNIISTYNVEPMMYEIYSKYYPEVFIKVVELSVESKKDKK